MPDPKRVVVRKKVAGGGREKTPAVSDLRSAFPVAVVCSDLHFSHTPPRNRAEKGKDWYRVMEASWRAVMSHAASKGVPVIVAGDIFHTWDNPAELVNAVITWFKSFPQVKIYAIPGQHDLPNHNYEDIHKSSYQTLVAAGAIEDMDHEFAYTYNIISRPSQDGRNVRLWPFPWGAKPRHPQEFAGNDWNSGAGLHVAVCHRYVWKSQETSYPGAAQDRHLQAYFPHLEAYDFAVFGDNHLGFSAHYPRLGSRGSGQLLNCGGFMRRNIDQQAYAVQYGKLMSDGSLMRHYYRPAGADAWTEQSVLQSLREIATATSPVARLEAVQQFIEEAGELLFDFRDVVAKYIQAGKLPAEVKKILEEVTGAKRPG